MIKAVLFDNDGTLVDTRDILLASMRYTMETVMHEDLTDEELLALVGTPLDAQMVHFAHGDQEKGKELARVYRAHNKVVHDECIKAFEGMPELLAELQNRGIAMGVVTAKLIDLCKHGLDLCGILSYMDVVVTPDTYPEVKPNPGPVLYGCEVLGVKPEECLYVGDSPYDMQAGNAAQCPTAAALWGMFSVEELTQYSPTYMCDDPLALLDLPCFQE